MSGGIKTDWGIIAANHLKETVEGTPYQKAGVASADNTIKMNTEGKNLSSPDVVAKAMSKTVNDPKPKTRYVVGFMSSTLIFMSKWLTARWFDALIMKMM